MLLHLKQLVCLLTCVGLMLPTMALAQCACCAQGCPAKAAQASADGCCQGQSCSKVDRCCQAKCCSDGGCCEESDSTIGPECSATCRCCDGEQPVEPAKSTPSQQNELQLDLLAVSAVATALTVDQTSAGDSLADDTRLVHSPVRLHALLGVWLN